jgi:polar amino acid transport system ATP-binding protein
VNGLESFEGGEIAVGAGRLTSNLSYGDRQRQLLRIRRSVGMVFQQFNLFPHMTVLANVIEAPQHVLKVPRERAVAEARTLLDRVGLGDRLDSRPAQLSGGQQQRVAIARALAMHPELILFDEPTSALDPKMTAEVLAVMADLARQGETMLVVTHAMTFARRVANDVHVIANGVIVESGPPAQIFEAPQHAETKELLQEE